MPSLVNRAAARALAAGVLFGSIAVSGGATAQTLKAVKERGAVVCGVSQGVVGFYDKSDKGQWTGPRLLLNTICRGKGRCYSGFGEGEGDDRGLTSSPL